MARAMSSLDGDAALLVSFGRDEVAASRAFFCILLAVNKGSPTPLFGKMLTPEHALDACRAPPSRIEPLVVPCPTHSSA
jgi:hypothetical protein